MRLHQDYCSHCPSENVVKDGRTVGHRHNRDKCRYCNPESFTQELSAYVNISHDVDKFSREMDEAKRGMEHANRRLKELHKKFKDHIGEGGVRIVNLCGVSVVLDWTGDCLRVSFAKAERNPDD